MQGWLHTTLWISQDDEIWRLFKNKASLAGSLQMIVQKCLLLNMLTQ